MSRVLTLLFLVTASFCSAQNIINNGGFNYGSSWSWHSILSVDFYSVTSAAAYTGQEGRVYTADGNGCVGVRAYSRSSGNWQEYIYQNISGEMKADTVYRVSIKYRLAPRCQFATDAMGIGFFSGYSNANQITQELVRQKIPEIRNTPGNILENNNAYHELVGYYTATGTENFVVFGSFATDATMSRQHITLGTPYANAWTPEYPTGKMFEDILYYMDQASITPCVDYPADPLPAQRIFCAEQMTQLSIPPDSSAQFLWSTGDTTPEIMVQAHNQEIWLEITKNGCKRRDTVKLVVFSGEIGLEDKMYLCREAEFPVTLSSKALPGENVYWNTGNTGYDLTVSTEGTYWLEKTLDDCKARDTITLINLENAATLFPNPLDSEFSIQNGEDAVILQIQSEDGKYVFLGEQAIAEVSEIVSELNPAIYFVTARIGECLIQDKFVKIKL